MRKKLQAFREELEQQRSLLFHEIATEAERIDHCNCTRFHTLLNKSDTLLMAE